MFGSSIKTYGKKKKQTVSGSGDQQTTSRAALNTVTNLPTLFEAENEAGFLGLESPLMNEAKGGLRNAKRGNPGTPREEVRTAIKTSRLFSPAVRENPCHSNTTSK